MQAKSIGLIRFDGFGHYTENWPLHFTQAGRDRLGVHRAVYAEIHPDVTLPIRAAPAAEVEEPRHRVGVIDIHDRESGNCC
ncbi:hypothetical protein [Streptomyces sp. Ncost-T10-10d]|uniref:hypothetical protein n=1 Tax=Streptomyces sp. Ncost-T10-10d TaxID=1839774 RepID=UPI000B89FBDD|nr:hypothetical protein [Streptomyces sp. Ncost-T10-10d]